MVAAEAQEPSLEQKLGRELVGQRLLLKHFFMSETQHFSADGVPLDPAPIGAWTVYGQIEVEQVTLAPEKVRLTGHRVAIGFTKEKRGFARYFVDTTFPVTIEIEVPLDGKESDIQAAIAKITITPQDNLADYTPEYWSAFLDKDWRPAPAPKSPSPPRTPVSYPFPQIAYPEVARTLKKEGKVVLKCQIDAKGNVRAVKLVQPAGFGMDDAAVGGVSMRKYKGLGVDVDSEVTINFALNELHPKAVPKR